MSEKFGLIYIASPYSHLDTDVREYRFERVREFTVHMMQRGFVAFSPIVYAHEMAQTHSLPTDFEYWQHFNETMMRRSDAICLLCLPGWEESRGITHELDFARDNSLSVFQYNPTSFEVQSFVER